MKSNAIDEILTLAEKRAIKDLQQIAKRWPSSLMLFGWSGSPVKIIKSMPEFTNQHIVVGEADIIADGGDPSMEEEGITPDLNCELIDGEWFVEKFADDIRATQGQARKDGE